MRLFPFAKGGTLPTFRALDLRDIDATRAVLVLELRSNAALCGKGYFLPKRLNPSPSSHQIQTELFIKSDLAPGIKQTC
jgi:hypothetical protein